MTATSVPVTTPDEVIGKFPVLRVLGHLPGRVSCVVRGDDGLWVVEYLRRASASPEEASFFLERCRGVSPIRHAGVPRVRAVIETPEHVGIATDLYDAEWLDELRLASFPLASRLRILVDLLGAVNALHSDPSTLPVVAAQAHVVHGEIAAGNILIGLDGSTRLARAARAFAARSRPETATAWVRCAAPEQLLDDATCDGRVDIYAVGTLLWHALAGRPLFEKDDASQVLSRQIAGDVPRPQLPAGASWATPLVDVAMKALAIDPFARYASAAELAGAIRLVAKNKLASPAEVGARVAELAGKRIRARRQITDADSTQQLFETTDETEVMRAPLPSAPPETARGASAPSERSGILERPSGIAASRPNEVEIGVGDLDVTFEGETRPALELPALPFAPATEPDMLAFMPDPTKAPTPSTPTATEIVVPPAAAPRAAATSPAKVAAPARPNPSMTAKAPPKAPSKAPATPVATSKAPPMPARGSKAPPPVGTTGKSVAPPLPPRASKPPMALHPPPVLPATQPVKSTTPLIVTMPLSPIVTPAAPPVATPSKPPPPATPSKPPVLPTAASRSVPPPVPSPGPSPFAMAPSAMPPPIRPSAAPANAEPAPVPIPIQPPPPEILALADMPLPPAPARVEAEQGAPSTPVFPQPISTGAILDVADADPDVDADAFMLKQRFKLPKFAELVSKLAPIEEKVASLVERLLRGRKVSEALPPVVRRYGVIAMMGFVGLLLFIALVRSMFSTSSADADVKETKPAASATAAPETTATPSATPSAAAATTTQQAPSATAAPTETASAAPPEEHVQIVPAEQPTQAPEATPPPPVTHAASPPAVVHAPATPPPATTFKPPPKKQPPRSKYEPNGI